MEYDDKEQDFLENLEAMQRDNVWLDLCLISTWVMVMLFFAYKVTPWIFDGVFCK